GGAWVTTYDGWREAVEHTVDISSGVQMVPVKQLVYGSDLDEILAYRRKVGTSWEDYHILHGGQDTASKLVNQSGQVVEQYEYDPFGKATVYTAAGALVDVGPAGTSPEDGTRSAYGLTHLYKAMRLDPETGNCYVRNRFYDPRTGRFMSRDPIGVWGDAGNMGNEYAYAWNRPLVVGDQLGLVSAPFIPGVHKNITFNANAGRFLDAKDLEKVIDANLAQDGQAYLAPFGVGPYANPANHGDNSELLATAKLIAARWGQVYDIMMSIHDAPCNAGEAVQELYDEALVLLGQILHAIQDLYAHTDYVERNGGSLLLHGGWTGSGEPVPVWDLFKDGVYIPKGVKSGTYTMGWDETCAVWFKEGGSHAMMGKDYPEHIRSKMPTRKIGADGQAITNFDLAHDVATRHSAQFLEEFSVLKSWAFTGR
ncbi:MAG: RHS repeat-associated core domain-containing protein, partial [Planctomycetota bacterium]